MVYVRVELKVQLYADDQKYGDEVGLTAANNWTYTWSQLPEKGPKVKPFPTKHAK